jgi:hypothetical protein
MKTLKKRKKEIDSEVKFVSDVNKILEGPFPSDFVIWPKKSILGNSDHEQIAIGIMRFLSKTGDTWRKVSRNSFTIQSSLGKCVN